MSRRALAFLLPFVFLATAVAAETAVVITHDGYLLDAADVPVDADVSLELRLLDAPAAGTQLWTATCMVTVRRGYYSVALGEGCGTGLTPGHFAGGTRYLEVVVGTTALTPRIALRRTPVAARADDSALLGGIPPEGFARLEATLGSPQNGSENIAGTMKAGAFVGGTFTGDGSGLTGVKLEGNTLAQLQVMFAPAGGVAAASVAPVACGAGTTGYLYFDTSSSSLLACNGTSFVAVGGAGGGASPGLSPPIGVTVTPGDTVAAFTWDPVVGATGYELGQSTGVGFNPSTATVVPVAGTSKTVTALTNLTTYYYAVRSVSSGTVSGWGAVLQTMPARITTTLWPADGQFQVSWTTVAGATAYEIGYRAAATFDPATATIVSATSTPSWLTGLTNNQIHVVAVRIAAPWRSAWSSAVTSTPVPLAPPTGITLTAGYQRVTGNWTAAIGAQGYEVGYSEGATFDESTASLFSTTVTNPTILPLLRNQAYTMAVRSSLGANRSGWSSPVAVTTKNSKWVFLSKNKVAANFAATDGIAAADTFCQNSAIAAGRPGTYQAWISNATSSPSTRFLTKATIAYTLVDGSLLFTNYAAMTSPGTTASPITKDEFGAANTAGFVFAFTFTNGTQAACSYTSCTCSNWTVTSGASIYASVGTPNVTSTLWSNSGVQTSPGCANTSSLYCFEQ